MIDRAIYFIVGGVIVLLGAYVLMPGRTTAIGYDRIIVHEIKGEPVVERTIVDRIVYRDRQPDLVVTQPSGGEAVVEAFCRPDTVEVVVEGQTLWLPSDTVFLMRSISTSSPWFFGLTDIKVWGPTSAGDLQEVRFRSRPGWTLRTDPELIFREPRFGWLHKAIEAGVYVGVGVLAGRIF